MTKLIFICLIFVMLNCEKKAEIALSPLPYYDEATFTPKWFASKSQIPKDFHKISSFSLQNQSNETINKESLEGKIYVVDFFFSYCTGICPKMATNMATVQDAFLEDEKLLILSHSVTPVHDSVSVLKTYGEINAVVNGKWHLLTGDRSEIYDLGRNQYFVEEDLGLEKGPDDFIHTENFVLVDSDFHIRGIYNGLNKSSVQQLIEDIKTLKALEAQQL